jgi:hypothetical protein
MAHKTAVVIKGEAEFFVKKAGKSFGVEIKDAKGNLVTKLYGSLGRTIRNSTLTIGEMLEGEKLVFDAPEKRVKKSAKKEVAQKTGRSNVRKDIDQLSKNIAQAFASFVK